MSKHSTHRPQKETIQPAAPLKQCLGVDVSKDSLEVCFSKMEAGQTVKIQGSRKFSNSPKGWKERVVWVARFRKTAEQTPFLVVMEATGVYHEGLAYHLKEAGLPVSIVLPNKVKHFAKSLNVKSKNDQMDAQVIAHMGLERRLDAWKGASPTMLTLKRLCRERESLLRQKNMVGNQLHALRAEHHGDKKSIKRRMQLIAYLDKQALAVFRQIQAELANDADLKAKIDNVCTIKGVNILTAVCVVAETDGFELIKNKNQLVSFAGYDVVERQSGTSLLGKTRISKKGNAHIRHALFCPAMTAVQHDPKMEALYQRVLKKNPKVKMIGAVAVQRNDPS